jgi:hypothetical protein
MGRRKAYSPMLNWEAILDNPAPRGHFVQLSCDDRELARSVGRYSASGLKRGSPVLLVAGQAHSNSFFREIVALGIAPDAAMNRGRLLVLDPRETLAGFMVNGQPDRTRFRKIAMDAIHRLQPLSEGPPVCAYGEMVGTLWTEGHYSAAIQLEALWNELLQSVAFTLFCAYPFDIFGDQFQLTGVDAILCDHTHLLPSGDRRSLERAIDRAMEERFRERSDERPMIPDARYRQSWAALPDGEAAILWIKKNLPEDAVHILHLVREYYAHERLAPCQ